MTQTPISHMTQTPISHMTQTPISHMTQIPTSHTTQTPLNPTHAPTLSQTHPMMMQTPFHPQNYLSPQNTMSAYGNHVAPAINNASFPQTADFLVHVSPQGIYMLQLI